MRTLPSRSVRKAWALISFGFLAITLIAVVQFNTTLPFLIGLALLLLIDSLVYGRQFYLLAHNPEEKLDERELKSQYLSYRYSYIALSTIILIIFLSITILNDFTKGIIGNQLPVLSDVLFWTCFYLTLKLPVAIIGWIEK